MTRDQVRSLTDTELQTLRTWLSAEYRRRKRIKASNDRWTANEGLEAALQASLKKP